MKVRKSILIAGLVLAGALNAGEAPPDAKPPIVKADLEAVVASGHIDAAAGVSAAGQPSAEALEVIRDNGYVAVIDLRGPDEDRGFDEASRVEELGMRYVPFPIESRAAISFDNARRLDELLQEQDGPVLLHCGSSNRVGALLALRASLDGASDEEALTIGREAGMTSLEAVVTERLSEK